MDVVRREEMARQMDVGEKDALIKRKEIIALLTGRREIPFCVGST